MSAPIPPLPIPLQIEDQDSLIDLGQLLDEIYTQGSYDLRINYHLSPIPSLSQADTIWLNTILKEQGLLSKDG